MAPIIVYYVASSEYPEFTGLQARTYPGQEKPRQQPILPERRFSNSQAKTQRIKKKTRVEKQQVVRKKRQHNQILPRISEEVANFTIVEIY